MPRFEPFRGLLYDEEVLAANGESMDRVVAPPYDVISPSERVARATRSVHNSVLVEVPADDPERGLNRYEVARRTLEGWIAEGVLRRDGREAFYGYSMTFADQGGGTRRTPGVIGALEVVEPGRGDVLPHEQTMPKPKGDRLDLLRATKANLSPIWGLSLADGLSEAIAAGGSPDLRASDEGVVHDLWRITDEPAVRRIRDLVSSAPVVIADGHHRYETARAYKEETRAAGSPQRGHEMVMTLVVELAEHELNVRPIHRLLTGLPQGVDLPALMRGTFGVFEAGPPAPSLLDRMEEHGALALVTASGSWLLEPRPETIAAAGMDVDSSLLELALWGMPPHEVEYEPDLSTVLEAVSSGRAGAAVLLRPASVAAISRTAWTREAMPPKTTFFSPKPRTGMVFRPLAD
jgi:uncharacterized protein (DUF1015 family)